MCSGVASDTPQSTDNSNIRTTRPLLAAAPKTSKSATSARLSFKLNAINPLLNVYLPKHSDYYCVTASLSS
ncbi:hypothetical protein UCMB321_4338 [Pseudomonas batumici]|uniref:Uncharacterized protein n=1 Tax=Pseudomonas batumici TaxID=226910 RepID=A0A0C2ETX8_9PSED|nr:hypothetical protein UCMB321_4312 [Pseudomonas batumici]KIH82033.1 hypothetical protein UCMB321_4338 [Pseudomonas batumici]